MIDQRLSANITGARWQLQRLAKLEENKNRSEALRSMLNEYIDNATQEIPVHQWTL